MKYILKSTFRNFIRKPVTNLINLLGLAISLALAIILSVYCYSELTTDHFHKNGDRVFLYGQLNGSIYTQGIIKDLIDVNVPGVESTVRISSTWSAPVFQVGNNEALTSDLIYADEDFFKLFSYNAVEGNLESALREPLSVVITKSLSDKLFGKGQVVGKTMKMNNDKELTVSAVLDDPTANTCLSFNAVTSNATKKIIQSNDVEFTNWRYVNFQTFIFLKKGNSPESVTKNIFSVIPKDEQKNFNTQTLIPLKKLYFTKSRLLGDNFIQFGDKKKVMILLMVASLVLLIALVNFVNISSSQWMEKTKQTGVMKVIGAKRQSILLNVLAEASLFFLISLFLAVILAILIAPFIKDFTGIHFSHQWIFTPGFILIAVGGTLVLSLFFNIIPALRISSSRAVDNMKNTTVHGKTDFSLSGVFVTAQFIIAIVLIAFTVLVQKQVRFGSNLGFNRENIIGIKLTPQLNQKKEVLKKMLLEKPPVKDISYCKYFPGKQVGYCWGTKLRINGGEKEVSFDMFFADASIFETMGLQLSMGRFYTDNISTDMGKIVVNETFLREYGITNPIGSNLIMGFDNHTAEIIGVFKDFYFKSVSQPITPLAIINGTNASYCLAKLQTVGFDLMHSAIQDIKAVTSELSPSFPVEISFFNQAVEQMYQSELQFRRTFTLFAGCAIVICCLGILAMSLFACQRRVKEIGIRKVNGAKISEILTMLNKDFVKWVFVAFLIATPISYYSMHKWLENFAYKTELNWWIFALAGLLALGIALLTVSWQSWRAATRNPVEALRYE